LLGKTPLTFVSEAKPSLPGSLLKVVEENHTIASSQRTGVRFCITHPHTKFGSSRKAENETLFRSGDVCPRKPLSPSNADYT
jgi:hypothetical protein